MFIMSQHPLHWAPLQLIWQSPVVVLQACPAGQSLACVHPVQTPLVQVGVGAPQTEQLLPEFPHALFAVPAAQVPPLQQPPLQG